MLIYIKLINAESINYYILLQYKVLCIICVVPFTYFKVTTFIVALFPKSS